MRTKELANKARIKMLERELDLLQLAMKHILSTETQVSISLKQLMAADDAPRLEIIEDIPNERIIFKYEGADDLIIA